MPTPTNAADSRPDAARAHEAPVREQERTSADAIAKARVRADQSYWHHAIHLLCGALEAQQRDIAALREQGAPAAELLANLFAANKGFSDRNHALEARVRRLDEVTAERDQLRRECEVKSDAIVKLSRELNEARSQLYGGAADHDPNATAGQPVPDPMAAAQNMPARFDSSEKETPA